MTFPTIQYKATNTELEVALTDLTDQKFHALSKFMKEEDGVRCEVEFEKETGKQSGNVFRVKANLTVNGKLFRAEASEDSFEKAVDEVRNELDKELRRHSGKKEALFKKGGKAIKDMLRLGK
jgi:ribosomal subunit interface protein